MTSDVLPVTGYLDRLSVMPGEVLRAHISKRRAGPIRARLVRVISGDPNPAGPGMKFEDFSHRFDKVMDGKYYPIRLGSYAMAGVTPASSQVTQSTWTALVWPSYAYDGYRTILSHEDGDASLSIRLGMGGVEVWLGDLCLTLDADIHPLHWYRIWVAVDQAARALTLGIVPVDSADKAIVRTAGLPESTVPSGGHVLVAARDSANHHDHFDGRIEDPAVLSEYCSSWSDPLIRLTDMPQLAAGWSFSRGIGSQKIFGVGPRAKDGVLVNLPMDAVRGARWTGEELCWRHAPDHYGAIHFHSDDLGDCDWPVAFEWEAPTDLRSGAYAFHLSCDDGEDWLPFYVRPAHDATERPAVLYLASTYTYQAYANHARGNFDDAFRARVQAWGAYPYNADDFPIYGRSTYNRHPDNSGIAYSSRLRPMLTMRPGYLTFNDPKGSGLRHYPADTHLLAWLEDKQIASDVITDEDLDAEGAAILEPYKAVLTGSHPEYHTAATWDALFDYTRHGGRLAYLGGNGFYWRIGRDPNQPGVIEMRRSEGGTRAWASEPGEYYNSLDGCYSGMWRRNGRDPQQLVGVGFTGQSAYEATYYRRQFAADDPRCAWIFAGMTDEIIGDYGLSAGGAAGFEFDRADVSLGTPRDALVLATSENPPSSFFTVMEELLGPQLTLAGGTPEPLIRADMVYFELDGGGAVFSVGSITFCGSLWRSGFEGPVSKILENVISGFCGRPPVT